MIEKSKKLIEQLWYNGNCGWEMAFFMGKALSSIREGDYLFKTSKYGGSFWIAQVQKIRAKTMIVQQVGYEFELDRPLADGLVTSQVLPYTVNFNMDRKYIVPILAPNMDAVISNDQIYYRIDTQIVNELFDDTKRIYWDGTNYYLVTVDETRIITAQQMC